MNKSIKYATVLLSRIPFMSLRNHRTVGDFNDALVSKFFVFQFINNYFVLFYIAHPPAA